MKVRPMADQSAPHLRRGPLVAGHLHRELGSLGRARLHRERDARADGNMTVRAALTERSRQTSRIQDASAELDLMRGTADGIKVRLPGERYLRLVQCSDVARLRAHSF